MARTWVCCQHRNGLAWFESPWKFSGKATVTTQLAFERLLDAVASDAVALRSRLTLQPAYGEGVKVLPPSCAVEGRADHKYAVAECDIMLWAPTVEWVS